MNTQDSYWQMIDQWRAVLVTPGTDESKQEASQQILLRYLAHKAMSHVNNPNPDLRLYADMLVLRGRLSPFGSWAEDDELVRLAIRPMFWLVQDWLARNHKPVLQCPAAEA